jgi:RNA-binding protein 5/10
VYDETSGYYYDATSTLYYDANSQYYFNSKTNQYMYWSSEHETFLPAPDSKENSAQDTDKKGDKKDKVKTAKRIAKDMEKWAKTLNQRKEAAKTNQVTANPQSQPGGLTKINIGSNKYGTSDQNNAGAEDIVFSMLNKRDGNSISSNASNIHSMSASNLDQNDEPPPPGSRPLSSKFGDPGLTGLASYNSDSDEESSNNLKSSSSDDQHTDWEKMACLLCQRQFPSIEKLTK